MAASRRIRHEVGPQKTLPTVQSFGVFFGRRRQRLTVVESFRYLLTDPGQFDILQFGWQGTKCNSMN
jgi:hypothetical protein